MVELSTEQRSEQLQRVINEDIAFHRGRYRVTQQTATQATLTTGRRPSHVLHLILTIVTAGLWGLVWIGVALTNKERSFVVAVDAQGNVLRWDPVEGPPPAASITRF